MRNLAVSIVAAAMSASLTGCGGNGSSAPAAPASNSTAPIQVSADGSGVPVTMNFALARQGESATRVAQTITVASNATLCTTSAASGVCGMTVQAYAVGTSAAAPTAQCGTTPTAGGCVADLIATGATVTATIIVPVGTDTFVVKLYGIEPTQTGGVWSTSGTANSTAQTTTTIALNASNTVNLAFAGPGAPAQTLPSAPVKAGGSVAGTVNLQVPAGACPSTCGVGAATVALTISLAAQRSPQNATGPPAKRVPQAMIPASCPLGGTTAATSSSLFVTAINLGIEGGAFYSADNLGASEGLYPPGLAIGASLIVTSGSALASALGSSGTFNVAYLSLDGSTYVDTGTVSYAYVSGTGALSISDTGSAGAVCSGTYVLYLNQTIGIPVIF